MHAFDAPHPPQLARLLGFAGLVPFVTGALGIWLTPIGWRPLVLAALLDYAAVILAFMGAIHWGLAMRAGQEDTRARLQLGFSVIPALFGWVAISAGLPAGLAVAVFIPAFIGLYLADLRAVRLGLAPGWYPALRRPLTIGVVTNLLVAWGGLLLGQPG
ncbi:DUF3429 domain-containing protein [Metapseudomonas otitidis]|uniref:DUF3429 domain-containing protein n=1 Tax=Metapseudomonas otitidis TaxID=319939 RepID=UPI00227CF04A|nr:DUF3429 domain-containing protein [Pseudomonas otitidis]WAF87736.1 DUF3429 domain-containing protein [Pseudomonas otitidis]